MQREAWGVIDQPSGRARPFDQSRSLDARGTMSQVRVYKDVGKWRDFVRVPFRYGWALPV